jgi:hypothetical protein
VVAQAGKRAKPYRAHVVGLKAKERTMSKKVDRLLADNRQSFLYQLSYAQVGEWLQQAEAYNRFYPGVVLAAVDHLHNAHPEGKFYIGDECGRIMYFDTGVSFMELLANEKKAKAMNTLERKVQAAADEVRYQMGELLENNILNRRKNALGRSQYRFGRSTVFFFWWD